MNNNKLVQDSGNSGIMFGKTFRNLLNVISPVDSKIRLENSLWKGTGTLKDALHKTAEYQRLEIGETLGTLNYAKQNISGTPDSTGRVPLWYDSFESCDIPCLYLKGKREGLFGEVEFDGVVIVETRYLAANSGIATLHQRMNLERLYKQLGGED